MRLFLAIDIPSKVKQNLKNQISALQKEYPQFDWIPQENYHVTVYFIGDAESADSIIKKIEEAVFDKEWFHMYSFALNIFVNHKIVLHLNFLREKNLEIISDRLHGLFNIYGDPIPQKYIPHLTLARARLPSKQQYFVLKKRINKFSVDLSFQVKKLVLFESINAGKYPEYKKVKVITLLPKE